MENEFYQLDKDTQIAVLRVVDSAREKKGLHTLPVPKGDVYAYEGNAGIHWGHNGLEGFCQARGVMK